MRFAKIRKINKLQQNEEVGNSRGSVS